MTKIKTQFKNDKKVIGRTSKKYPKQLQTDETVYGIEVESGTMIRVVKIDKLTIHLNPGHPNPLMK